MCSTRFAPFVGTSYEKGVTLSGKPVEVYAFFGGQWPHSSFMIPGGVMCAPTLSDVTRAIAILDYWKREWLETTWLGCSVDRWLENKTWADVLKWADENDSQRNSDCGLFLRFAQRVGLDKFGQGCGAYLATGTYFQPELYENPTIDGRNDALINRSGIYDGSGFHDFDHLRVKEDITHSFYRGTSSSILGMVSLSPLILSMVRNKASIAGRNRRDTMCLGRDSCPSKPVRSPAKSSPANPMPPPTRISIRYSSMPSEPWASVWSE